MTEVKRRKEFYCMYIAFTLHWNVNMHLGSVPASETLDWHLGLTPWIDTLDWHLGLTPWIDTLWNVIIIVDCLYFSWINSTWRKGYSRKVRTQAYFYLNIYLYVLLKRPLGLTNWSKLPVGWLRRKIGGLNCRTLLYDSLVL